MSSESHETNNPEVEAICDYFERKLEESKGEPPGPPAPVPTGMEETPGERTIRLILGRFPQVIRYKDGVREYRPSSPPPKVPCVFYLATEHEVLYVGKTTRLEKAVAFHAEDIPFDRVFIFDCESHSELEKTTLDEWVRLRPRFNTPLNYALTPTRDIEGRWSLGIDHRAYNYYLEEDQ